MFRGPYFPYTCYRVLHTTASQPTVSFVHVGAWERASPPPPALDLILNAQCLFKVVASMRLESGQASLMFYEFGGSQLIWSMPPSPAAGLTLP